MAGADGRVLQLIRQVVLEEAGKLGIEVERIILFGSRARGDARPDSDYDILVVVKGEIGRGEMRRLARSIRGRLARQLIPCDIVVATAARWRRFEDVVGHLFHAVKQEGVAVW